MPHVQPLSDEQANPQAQSPLRQDQRRIQDGAEHFPHHGPCPQRPGSDARLRSSHPQRSRRQAARAGLHENLEDQPLQLLTALSRGPWSQGRRDRRTVAGIWTITNRAAPSTIWKNWSCVSPSSGRGKARPSPPSLPPWRRSSRRPSLSSSPPPSGWPTGRIASTKPSTSNSRDRRIVS